MKRIILLCFCLVPSVCFLLFPDAVKASVASSFSLCSSALFPSLFPFFVISNFIINARLIPPSPMVFGAVGGYPVGASVICDLYERGLLSKEDAEGALPYCSLCGPGFIFGAGISIFKSFTYPLILWAAHLAGAFIIRHFSPKITAKKADSLPISASFTQAVKGAFSSCLNVCAYVIFFSLICDLFPIPAFLSGCIELSRGVFSLSNTPLHLICAAFYISFGGLCVSAQVVALCHDAHLSARRHFIGKLIHGALAAVFVLFLTFFIL